MLQEMRTWRHSPASRVDDDEASDLKASACNGLTCPHAQDRIQGSFGSARMRSAISL